jgi:hypothetical protein
MGSGRERGPADFTAVQQSVPRRAARGGYFSQCTDTCFNSPPPGEVSVELPSPRISTSSQSWPMVENT